MDQSADDASRITVRIPFHQAVAGPFFEYLGVGKNLAIEAALDEVAAVELTDQKIRISGFWPAVLYICERYPQPELQPGDCIQRSLVRSLTAELLELGAPTGAFAKAADKNGLILDRPTLLDVAYLAVTDAEDPTWSGLRAAFYNWIEEQHALNDDDDIAA